MKWDATREDLTAVVPPWFQRQMQAKLAENQHKPSWRTQPDVMLIWLFLVEVGELLQAIAIRRPAAEVVAEAADVANFAMFLADKFRLREYQRLIGAPVRVIAPGHPEQGMVGTVRSVNGSDCGRPPVWYTVDLINGEAEVLQASEFEVIKRKRLWPWTK